MQTVTSSRWVQFPIDFVYLTLTDPQKLVSVVKRLKKIDVLERTEKQGSVIAQIDLPGGKLIETHGTVTGTPDKKLSFSTDKPLPLTINWELEAAEQSSVIGTAITYSVSVDFSPMVAFVSGIVLKGYLSSEMEQDLQNLVDLLAAESQSTPA